MVEVDRITTITRYLDTYMDRKSQDAMGADTRIDLFGNLVGTNGLGPMPVYVLYCAMTLAFITKSVVYKTTSQCTDLVRG